nr:hypothetical protein [uncultured Flavobacterium sp.]
MAVHTSTNSPDCGCSDGGSGGGGGTINQNNMFVVVEIAWANTVQSPPDADVVAGVLNALPTPFIFSEIQVSVIGVLTVAENKALKYYYAFKNGKGTYGNGGTAFTGSMLHCISERRYTVNDFNASLNANITDLGNITASYLDEMNSADRAFTDANTLYFFKGIWYGEETFWLFTGVPGFYGGDGIEILETMVMEIDPANAVSSVGFKTAFGLVTTSGEFQNADLVGVSLVVQISSSATGGPQEGIFGIDSATGTVYSDLFYSGSSYSVIYK